LLAGREFFLFDRQLSTYSQMKGKETANYNRDLSLAG